MSIDYRDLLIKYILHIVACESIDYLSDHHRERSPAFTDEEWAELQRLAGERFAGQPEPPAPVNLQDRINAAVAAGWTYARFERDRTQTVWTRPGDGQRFLANPADAANQEPDAFPAVNGPLLREFTTVALFGPPSKRGGW